MMAWQKGVGASHPGSCEQVRAPSTADIYGIMGGNYARVMREALPARGCDAIL